MTKTVTCFGELLIRLTPPGAQLMVQAASLDPIVGGAEANVEARRCLAMGPGLRHAVTASDDAVFLLVIAARPDA